LNYAKEKAIVCQSNRHTRM